MYPKQKDETIQRNDYFTTINMPRNLFVDGANDNEQLSLLYLATIYGQLSKKSGIWQVMLADLSQIDGYNLARIAQELHVKDRTVQRVINGQTRKPTMATTFRLFMLHLRHCFHRYQQAEILPVAETTA